MSGHVGSIVFNEYHPISTAGLNANAHTFTAPEPACCTHSTYLNGNVGWPHQPVEDTYDLPPHTWTPPYEKAAEKANVFLSKEYSAVFDDKGAALLVLNEDKQTTIATFDTFADAQKAAEALNNHEGL